MWNVNLSWNIKKFYLMKVFMSFFFAVPILVLFWQDYGLSMTQIMLLQTAFSVAVVFLEVPSWYFADMFGKKKSLILWAVFWFLGMSLYAIWHSFWIFIVAEILFAMWISALSGADSAFLYDTLVDLWRGKEYKKIWGNSLFIFLWFSAFAQLVWWFVAKFGLPFGILAWIDLLRLTIIIWLPLTFLAIPIAFSFQEPSQHKKVLWKHYLKDLFSVLKKEVWWNKKLLRMMIFFAFLMTSIKSWLRFYQPYFQLIGVDVVYFGIIFAWFQLFSGISSKFTNKIEKKIWLSRSLLLNVILMIVSYFLMWSFVWFFSLIFCFLQQFVRWFNSVMVSDYVNHRVSSQYRATINSIQNLGGSLIYALLVPIFGWFADIYSLEMALILVWITISILLIPVVIVLITKKVIKLKPWL